MSRPRPTAVAIFAAWTLLVWVQRAVNVVRSDTLSSGDRWGAMVRPAAFVLIGLAVGAVAVRPVPAARGRWIVRVGAWATIALWLVQTVIIATRDYSTAFIAVHAVLGIVSIGLAVQAVRSTVTSATARPHRPGPGRAAGQLSGDPTSSAPDGSDSSSAVGVRSAPP